MFLAMNVPSDSIQLTAKSHTAKDSRWKPFTRSSVVMRTSKFIPGEEKEKEQNVDVTKFVQIGKQAMKIEHQR